MAAAKPKQNAANDNKGNANVGVTNGPGGRQLAEQVKAARQPGLKRPPYPFAPKNAGYYYYPRQ